MNEGMARAIGTVELLKLYGYSVVDTKGLETLERRINGARFGLAAAVKKLGGELFISEDEINGTDEAALAVERLKTTAGEPRMIRVYLRKPEEEKPAADEGAI